MGASRRARSPRAGAAPARAEVGRPPLAVGSLRQSVVAPPIVGPDLMSRRRRGSVARSAAPSRLDEEAAAIVAAVELTWPRPSARQPCPRPATPRWRFSGRWWSQPIPVRRTALVLIRRCAVEVTTVADDLVGACTTAPASGSLRRARSPDTDHELDGFAFAHPAPPPGELLCRVRHRQRRALRRDRVRDHRRDAPTGPILRDRARRRPPYPEVMNRGAVAEMRGHRPGRRRREGRPDRRRHARGVRRLPGLLRPRSATACTHVRGNHDAYRGETVRRRTQRSTCPGSPSPCSTPSSRATTAAPLDDEQLDWLDDLAAASRPSGAGLRPPPPRGAPTSEHRPDTLLRHPPRRLRAPGRGRRPPRPRPRLLRRPHPSQPRAALPGHGRRAVVEVACVKDFPGTWAEYRVFEGGILQVHHRISTPEALAWTERCRGLYARLRCRLHRLRPRRAGATAASPSRIASRPRDRRPHRRSPACG